MKIIYFILFFFGVNFYVYSQDQQKLGSIVFESCKFIGNKHLAPTDVEKKKEANRLRKFVEKKIDSEKPDEFINSIPKTDLEIHGDSLKCTYKLDIYKDTYESRVICTYLEKTNVERYKQIHPKDLMMNIIERDISSNTYKIFPKSNINFYSTKNRYKLIEFRDDTKTILGYKCFKVVLKKQFQKNPHLTMYDYEMYVTEDIKLDYSPITLNKHVLEKYFPLEIIKKPREERMVEMISWKVNQIDLKNVQN